MRTRSLSLTILALLLGAPPASGSEVGVSDSALAGAPASLASTADVPWVPATPVPAAEIWESALRFPGRVVSFPVSLLGNGLEWTLEYAEDQVLLSRIAEWLAWQQRIGFVAGSASLGDGAGLGAMALWSPPPLAGHLTAEFSTTTASYNRTRFGAHAGPVSVIYSNEWRPEDSFHGRGMDALDGDESHYAVHREAVRLVAAYPPGQRRQAGLPPVARLIANPGGVARPLLAFAVWAGPGTMRLSRGRASGAPSFEEQFPELAAQAERGVEHLVYGARVTLDRRSGHPHWTHGWRGALSAERFDRPIEALALRDAHPDAQAFTRLSCALEGGFSFWRDPRTIRLRLEAVDQRSSGGGAFLIPSLSRLGASEGLSGFEAGRFHDMDRLLGRLAYIFPLGKNLEFEWFTEAGAVFPELEAARMDAFETAYGGLLRIRGDAAMIGMVGLAWSREGARVRFSIGGVE